jgi:hypothetical protein
MEMTPEQQAALLLEFANRQQPPPLPNVCFSCPVCGDVFETGHTCKLERVPEGEDTLLMKYGYARVSTDDQTPALQLAALKRAGCKVILKDDGLSGATTRRPALLRCLKKRH